MRTKPREWRSQKRRGVLSTSVEEVAEEGRMTAIKKKNFESIAEIRDKKSVKESVSAEEEGTSRARAV